MTGMSIRSAALAGIAVSVLAAPARADSDGSFCVGSSYLAYELSLTGAAREHALFIVQLTDSVGIARPLRIRLPNFQVHGMRCNRSSVELLGWDSVYTVPLRTGADPVAQVAPWANQADRRLPQGYTPTDFWTWSPALRAGRSDTLSLPVEATARRFVLVRDVVANPHNPCLYNLRAQVVQFDANGPLGSLILVDRERHRECGN